jgi:hypothetical protein
MSATKRPEYHSIELSALESKALWRGKTLDATDDRQMISTAPPQALAYIIYLAHASKQQPSCAINHIDTHAARRLFITIISPSRRPTSVTGLLQFAAAELTTQALRPQLELGPAW